MKKVITLILTAVLFLTVAAPAFAAEKYEISDRITKVEDIGTEFYPYVKTSDECEALLKKDIGKKIIADLKKKFGTEESWHCILGEGKAELTGTPLYFGFYFSSDLQAVIYDSNVKTNMEQCLESSIYSVCRPKPVSAIPTTGDNTPIALTAGLLLVSGAALIVLRKRSVR